MSTVKVVTGQVRFSYCNIFEARASQEGGDPKFSVSLLIPKSDKATIAAINKAVDEVIALNKASKFGGKDKGIKHPLRDGDTERDSPEYEGHYFINASSKQRPVIVDENRQAIIDSREVYSGCYGRASINLFAYATNGNKGVGAGLNSIQKLKDGDPLGATYTEDMAAKDFDDDLM